MDYLARKKHRLSAWVVTVALVLAVASASMLPGIAAHGQEYGDGLQLPACDTPITYAISDFDEEFGLSREEFLENLDQATDLWSEAAGKELFLLADSVDAADLVVNLTYDWRQESVDRLRELDMVLEQQNAEYDRGRAEYDAMVATYGSGSMVPPAFIDAVNAQAGKLNLLADRINSHIDEYNRINERLRGGFAEGAFTVSSFGNYLEVFEFESDDQLDRLLAHEFGHALGLDHSDSRDDVMYPVNVKTAPILSADDIAQLEEVCSL